MCLCRVCGGVRACISVRACTRAVVSVSMGGCVSAAGSVTYEGSKKCSPPPKKGMSQETVHLLFFNLLNPHLHSDTHGPIHIGPWLHYSLGVSLFGLAVQAGKQWDLSWVDSALLMFLFKSCGQWTPSCVSRFGLAVRPPLPTETLSLIAAHLNAEDILKVTV